jgi:hypothetical protein
MRRIGSPEYGMACLASRLAQGVERSFAAGGFFRSLVAYGDL